jgi:enterochelin esterase-like enzyme
MQPTSPLFLGFLGALTIAVAVITVLTWDRARFKRVRRVSSLLLTQVLVVIVGLGLVNASQGFFTAWSDFGGSEAHGRSGRVVAAEHGSQLTSAVEAARKHVQHGHGVMVSADVAGKRTGYRLPVRIYLPAAYFDRAQSDRIFPVVMFFNGFLGGPDTFQERLGGTAVLDSLIASGEVPPMVVVSTEKNPSRPKDSECVDAVGGDQVDTYLTQDLTGVVKRELRVGQNRDGWALMGYSTGGFCATNLALRHPREFSAAVSFSGNYIPYVDSTTGDLFRGDAAARIANTPQAVISEQRSCPQSFYLFASRGDPVGYRELKAFTPKLKDPDAGTVVLQESGGHNFGVWHAALPKAFIWIGRVLHPYGTGGCPAAAVDPGKSLASR